MANIEGLDELLANLSGLGGNVKESARKGLERGAKKIQRNAKLLCPVRKPSKTKSKTKSGGQLRNSIKTNSKTTAEGVEAQVFTNSEYGFYVNFGTGKRGAKQDDNGNPISHRADWEGQAPQPFMSSAYLHAKDSGEVEQEVIKSIQQDIRKLESGKK